MCTLLSQQRSRHVYTPVTQISRHAYTDTTAEKQTCVHSCNSREADKRTLLSQQRAAFVSSQVTADR
ncbi:hypothetical protein Hamer_G001204 [Homarus americanus]|uniref:Uncharacterized protein n=1 Tax=Homarus americanus TaxID=6706 RepID=A0A8J5TI72_HOMAM|nr:hypothetical protein Hamer_G001204 [Homarus americanus]